MRPGLKISILILVIFCGLFIQYQFRAPLRNFSDYRVYYAAGKNILEGEDIYIRYSQEITPFKYSPFFAVLISPLSLPGIRTSANLFFILNLVFLLAIFWFAGRVIFTEEISLKNKFIIVAVVSLLSIRFILHCLHSGQVGLLILALLLAGLYLVGKNKIVLGAFLIGAAVMTKYMPVIFTLYFIFKKEYKIAFFVMLSLAFYLVIPALFIGFETNTKYLLEWLPYITSTSLDAHSMADTKNNSLWAIINRLFPHVPSIACAIIVGVIFFLLFAFIIFDKKSGTRNQKSSVPNRSVDYGLILICTALFNPNAWQHNFVVLIFPYMLCMYYLFRTDFKDRGVVILTIISFIFCSWFSQSVVGNSFKEYLDYFSSIFFGSAVLFMALVKIKFNPNLLFYDIPEQKRTHPY